MAENTPLYNLKAVIKEVGINPVTLRAWERRYGLIKPRRSPGGHRLYSRQDIELLKWLIERQDEGLSISSAIEMWKSQHQFDQATKVEQLQTPVSIKGTGESILDTLRERWLSACLSYDDVSANRVLDEAFATASPEIIIDEVLQKGLAWIGGNWYTGTVSVQQEHFASAIATRRIHVLISATAPPTRPGHILAACPPGEEHTFTLLVVTYFLRRRGFNVIYLGPNVPLNELDKTIQTTSPVLVLSAAQTLTAAASLHTLSEYLNSLGIPMVYGGGIFSQIPELPQFVSGYYLGTDIGRVVLLVERVISEPSSMPIARMPSKPYSQVLSKFMENEAAILARVSSAFRPELIHPAQLESANLTFSRFITSALTLGDISLLDQMVERINHNLQSFGLTAALITKYYTAYHQAVELSLGKDGAIILDWLAKQEIVL